MRRFTTVLLACLLILSVVPSLAEETPEMKIEILSDAVICSNDEKFHNYFGWPSVTRLQDGRLAMVASGFRAQHIDPFGVGVICYSSDEGATWTAPVAALDTILDDRDCGIVPFGENGVMVTSFNNTYDFQYSNYWGMNKGSLKDKIKSYLKELKAQDWESYYGSTFVLSHDGGNTFGEVQFAPVTSPHGPSVMQDGSLLYVGRVFAYDGTTPQVASYRWTEEGGFELLGYIPDVTIPETEMHEAHQIQLASGKIVVHIRIEGGGYFSTFQSVSTDGGVTWTEPEQLLENKGGAPAHLLECSDGTLISAYGYRNAHCGIRMMYSLDEGETWNTDNLISDTYVSSDLGYPASVEISDGKILTVYYARESEADPAVIHQVVWSYSFE